MVSVLTVAGSDSGGGAGLQADLKTFEALGVFGTSVVTAITAQNTTTVEKIWQVPVEMVEAQLKAILSDFRISAAKTGMLFDSGIIEVVSKILSTEKKFPLVIDPVMVSSSGERLFRTEAMNAFKELLLPIADLVTPNIHEAEILTGVKINSEADMIHAAVIIQKDSGKKIPVLLKGSHLHDGKDEMPVVIRDLLFIEGVQLWIDGPYIKTKNTHGTGCTLSAAITAGLAMGKDLVTSVRNAKQFVTQALVQSWSGLGKGNGTLRHNWQSEKINT